MFEDKVRVLKFQQTRNYKQITSGNQRESFFVQRFFAVKEMLRQFVFCKYRFYFVPIILSFLTERKERITCTPTRKKRMRLLRSASTHFVRSSGLPRGKASRNDVFLWIATGNKLPFSLANLLLFESICTFPSQ